MMVARSFEVSPKKPLVAVRISSWVYLSVVFSWADSGAGTAIASGSRPAAAENKRRDSTIMDFLSPLLAPGSATPSAAQTAAQRGCRCVDGDVGTSDGVFNAAGARRFRRRPHICHWSALSFQPTLAGA